MKIVIWPVLVAALLLAWGCSSTAQLPDGGVQDGGPADGGGFQDGGPADGGWDGGAGDGGIPDYLKVTHTEPPEGHIFLDFNEFKIVLTFDRPLDPATVVRTPKFHKLILHHADLNPLEEQFDSFVLKDNNRKIEFTLHGAHAWNNRYELFILQTLRGQDGTHLEQEFKLGFSRPHFFYFNGADSDPQPAPPQFFTYAQAVTVFEKGVPTSGPADAYEFIKCWATNLDGDYPLVNTEVYDGGMTVGEVPEADMVSPLIDLTNVRSPLYLTFHHWFDIPYSSVVGNAHMGIQVKARKEGESWTVIQPLTGVLDQHGKSIGYMKRYGVTIAYHWTETSNGQWRLEVFDLNDYIGHKMQFLFRLFQFVATGPKFPGRPGWYIDNIWVKQMKWPP